MSYARCSRCGVPVALIRGQSYGDCCETDAEVAAIVERQSRRLPKGFWTWADMKRDPEVVIGKVEKITAFIREHGPAGNGAIAKACGLTRTEVVNVMRSPRWGKMFVRVGRAKCIGSKWALADQSADT